MFILPHRAHRERIQASRFSRFGAGRERVRVNEACYLRQLVQLKITGGKQETVKVRLC